MAARPQMISVLVYATTLWAALLWAWLGGFSLLQIPSLLSAERALSLSLSIAAGLGLAIVVILATRQFVRSEPGARLATEFHQLLGHLRGREIALLALGSGVAEELLFRGAIQSQWGFLPATLLFGLAHVPPSRVFLPWTVSALSVGAALGGIYALTGELVGVVLAHVLINYENLYFVVGFNPTPESPPGSFLAQ